MTGTTNRPTGLAGAAPQLEMSLDQLRRWLIEHPAADALIQRVSDRRVLMPEDIDMIRRVMAAEKANRPSRGRRRRNVAG